MKVEVELRPCIVNDKKALFHKWSDRSEIVPPSSLRGGHVGGVVSGTFGIIELENGTVKECYPHEVKFLDEKHKEFIWE